MSLTVYPKLTNVLYEYEMLLHISSQIKLTGISISWKSGYHERSNYYIIIRKVALSY